MLALDDVQRAPLRSLEDHDLVGVPQLVEKRRIDRIRGLGVLENSDVVVRDGDILENQREEENRSHVCPRLERERDAGAEEDSGLQIDLAHDTRLESWKKSERMALNSDGGEAGGERQVEREFVSSNRERPEIAKVPSPEEERGLAGPFLIRSMT